MLNLIQESDQDLMKHMCKLCDKSFPTGRSLGGHMRSHMIWINSSTDHDHDHDQQMKNKKKKQMKKLSLVNNGSSNSNNSVYEVRKDPKKPTKVKDSSEVVEKNNNCLVVLDKLCKECGKGFQSWKALFGHMKCHSEKVLNDNKNNNNNNNNLNQDSWTSQSDNENSGAKGSRIKKSRSRNNRIKRYIITSTTTATTITTASSSVSMNANNTNNSNQISSNYASTSTVSEMNQDQESEVALCLMMLSRDEGIWGNEIESFDNCNPSAFVNLTKVEGKKPIENGPKIKKIENSQFRVDYIGRSEVGSGKFEEIMIQNDEFYVKSEVGFGKFEDSSKRKFECLTCNKSFHSYQALGGHKTSHKKLKGRLDSKTEGENPIENKPLFNHELINHGFGAKPSENHYTTKSFNLGSGSLKKTVVLGSHKCPICSKVFSSGQALGGHKRSHMVAEAKLNQQKNMNLIEKVNEPVHETRGLLDLNLLPDTMEEDMIINSSTIEYKPWHWVDTTNHDSTTLLGLLSTI